MAGRAAVVGSQGPTDGAASLAAVPMRVAPCRLPLSDGGAGPHWRLPSSCALQDMLALAASVSREIRTGIRLSRGAHRGFPQAATCGRPGRYKHDIAAVDRALRPDLLVVVPVLLLLVGVAEVELFELVARLERYRLDPAGAEREGVSRGQLPERGRTASRGGAAAGRTVGSRPSRRRCRGSRAWPRGCAPCSASPTGTWTGAGGSCPSRSPAPSS